MGSRKGRERVIAALYQAGMGQLDWGAALDVLAGQVGAGGITLDTYDFDASRGTVLASNMAPDPAIAEYNAVYGQANPLAERTRRQLRQGLTYRASDFVPTAEFVRTELYNTVYRKLGLKHLTAVALDYRQSRSTQFSVIKPTDAADFSDREVALLADMQVHARQAWAGYRALARTQRRLDELTSLWNLVEFAVLVVDSSRRIRFANRAAEDLLRALSRPGAESSAESVGANLLRDRSLKAALNAVLVAGGVRHAGTLELPRFEQLRATVFELSDDRAAVLIIDPLRQRNLPLDAFRQRFALTEAEARVVRRLVHGDSLREAAEHIGIGYETARSQLKSAMAKNGWRRQSALLVAVLAELLPLGQLSRRPSGSRPADE